MKKLGTLLVLFLSVIALVACASGKKDAASGQKLKVVATNSIIADITKILLVTRLIFTVSFRLDKTHTNTNHSLKMLRKLLRLTSFSITVSTLKQVAMLGLANW